MSDVPKTLYAPPARKVRSSSEYFKYFVGIVCVAIFAYVIRQGTFATQQLRTVVGLSGSFAIFLLSFYFPLVPLFIFLAYNPFSSAMPADFGSIMRALNLTNILLVSCFVGWVSLSIRGKQKFWHHSELGRAIAVFLLLVTFSYLYGTVQFGGSYFTANIWGFKRWTTPFITYYFIYNLVRDRENFKVALMIMLLIIPVQAHLGLESQGEVWHYSHESRMEGSFGHSNTMSAFICYYIFYHLGIAFTHIKNFRYWFLFLALIPGIKGILYTFSRGGYIGFSAGCLVVSFLWRRSMIAVVLLGMIFLYFNQEFLPQAVQERLAMTMQKDQSVIYGEEKEILEQSAAARLAIWEGGFKMILENPFLGLGFATFRFAIPWYANTFGLQLDAHNAYLLMAAENGIPTLCVLFWMFSIIVRASWRILKQSDDLLYQGVALGAITSVVTFVIVNCFGSRIYEEALVTYFWSFGALVMFMQDDVRRKAQEGECSQEAEQRKDVTYADLFDSRWGKGAYDRGQ